MGMSRPPRLAVLIAFSSNAAPDATRNGDGLPEVVRRAADGPSATSKIGFTVTVGECGPADAPPSAVEAVQEDPTVISALMPLDFAREKGKFPAQFTSALWK